MINRAALLKDYLNGARTRHFRPGEFECAIFAADWVKHVSGRDLAAFWRGKYNTVDEGLRLLQEHGHADHVALAASHLTEISGWTAAAVGDVAVVIEDGQPAFGIVSGGFVFVLRPRGLDVVLLSRAVRVFRP